MSNSTYICELNIKLKNITPFSSGDMESESFINDEKGKAIFLGSSVKGAIKNYIGNKENLFGKEETKDENGNNLEKVKFIESKVYFMDMKSDETINIIERDGIKIDGKFGSTLEGGKYVRKLIEVGKSFSFKVKGMYLTEVEKDIFESNMKNVIKAINIGYIQFGADKTKDFGKFEISESKYNCYDLSVPDDLNKYISEKENNHPFEWMYIEFKEDTTVITFQGKIKDSFLLKGVKEKREKDTIQHSLKENNNYIIPSGSIKGSMRAYMEKIMNTLHEKEKEHEVIRNLFGHKSDEEDQVKFQMGKLIISDCKIEKVGTIEYHRIKIDRFTGGAINGALINEKRLVDGVINLKIQVRGSLEPQEKALILLYLRDLGLGKITLGSNASVGSGRVEGISAEIDGININFKNLNNINEADKNKINSYISTLSGVNA